MNILGSVSLTKLSLFVPCAQSFLVVLDQKEGKYLLLNTFPLLCILTNSSFAKKFFYVLFFFFSGKQEGVFKVMTEFLWDAVQTPSNFCDINLMLSGSLFQSCLEKINIWLH